MNTIRLVGAGPLGGPISHSGLRLLTAGIAALLPLAALSGREQAWAGALPSSCAASGTTVTCTYTADLEGRFTVPRGVHHINVVAAGASGGSGRSWPGGAGAQVTAVGVIVTPGSTLYAEVDIGGGPGEGDTGRAGGGESDLRSCSITDPHCPAAGTGADPRLIVAGGGGGAGGGYGEEWGGSGGSAGVGTSRCNPGNVGTEGTGSLARGPGGPAGPPNPGGGGGGGGGCSSGGAGGAAWPGGMAGTGGTASSGGTGGSGGHGGGGGGAGYFGGGGGGQGAVNGGGGGGGSSSGPAGSTFATATTGPQVRVSYQAVGARAPTGGTAVQGGPSAPHGTASRLAWARISASR